MGKSQVLMAEERFLRVFVNKKVMLIFAIDKFEQWIYFMKNMHRLEKFPETSLRDEVFARLERVANYANLTPTEQAVYEADLRWVSEYDEEMATGKKEAGQKARRKRLQGLLQTSWQMV